MTFLVGMTLTFIKYAHLYHVCCLNAMKISVILIFCACLSLYSCAESNISEPRYFSNVADAEARWKAHNIKQYSLTQRRSCFCIRLNYPLTLTVENANIVRVRDARGDSVRIDLATSIEKIFADIRQMQGRSDASFQVEYDSVYGYPRYLSADPIKQAVDDEYVLETRLVR